jgi:hypothetical protein
MIIGVMIIGPIKLGRVGKWTRETMGLGEIRLIGIIRICMGGSINQESIIKVQERH